MSNNPSRLVNVLLIRMTAFICHFSLCPPCKHSQYTLHWHPRPNSWRNLCGLPSRLGILNSGQSHRVTSVPTIQTCLSSLLLAHHLYRGQYFCSSNLHKSDTQLPPLANPSPQIPST